MKKLFSSKSKDSVKKRPLRFEGLENREMLSATPVGYDQADHYVAAASAAQNTQADTQDIVPEARGAELVSALSANSFFPPSDARLTQTPGKEVSSITVTWNASRNADNTAIAKSYTVVMYDAVTKKKVKTVTVNNKTELSTGSAVISGLKSNTEYYATITAKGTKTVGASDPTTTGSLRTKIAMTAAKLKKGTVTDETVSFTVTNLFAIKQEAPQFLKVTCGDKVYTFTSNATGMWSSSSPNASFSGETGLVTLSKLDSNTSYKISAEFGRSDAVAAKPATLTLKTLKTSYAQVTGVYTYDKTDSGFKVAWTAARGKDVAAKLASSYTVTVMDLSGKTVKTVNTSKNAVAATVTGLKPNTDYKVTVTAKADSAYTKGLASVPVGVKTAQRLLAPKITTDSVYGFNAVLDVNCGYDLRTLSNLTISYSITGSGSGSYGGYSGSDSGAYSGVLSASRNLTDYAHTYTKKYGFSASATVSFTPNANGGKLLVSAWFQDLLSMLGGNGRGSGNLTITGISGVDSQGNTLSWSGKSVSPKVSMPR